MKAGNKETTADKQAGQKRGEWGGGEGGSAEGELPVGVVEHDVGLRDGRADDGSVGGGGGWHLEGGLKVYIHLYASCGYVYVSYVCLMGMCLDVCACVCNPRWGTSQWCFYVFDKK